MLEGGKDHGIVSK
ncbi:hypothetical protein CP10743SC13_2423A, partial [Chlamydia psittaci 10_743_SC13]